MAGREDSGNKLSSNLRAAELEPQYWPKVLGQIAQETGSTECVLLIRSQRGYRWLAAAGANVSHAAQRKRDGAARQEIPFSLNVGAKRDFRFLEADEVRLIVSAIDASDDANFRGASTGTVARLSSNDSLITVIRNSGNARTFDARAVEQLERLQPHIIHAAERSRILASQSMSATLDTLAALGYCGVVIDAQGAALLVTPGFNEILGSTLAVPNQVLSFADTRTDRVFRRLLAETQQKADSAARSIALQPQATGGPAVIHLVPLHGIGVELFFGGKWVLVPALPEASVVPRRSVLAALFGLTPAEAKVAKLLAKAMTANEIAAALKISRETARTHIKAVLGKSGSHRHADYVAKIAGLHAAPALGLRKSI
ncbi:helix-turn-helix transcriptional regulator [Microvirga rosea]|uniref:helix-turn-helix transcriptional regulator n=1 Tax=Microvirga rosea TaxID=2715425 RepID=UPI001D0AFF13|nr:helix-turn-helix transcriptional regulator [Microvirga rosea]MCB8820585.1 helix-turn-helix transcriptional regulator [Microvirga rosea]